MKVYLDNNATTQVDSKILEKMLPYFSEIYGNPSSLHSFGKKSKVAFDNSREIIANTFNVEAKDIIFTASASEANNLAIRGVAKAYKRRGNHIITSTIEHPAILNTCKALEDEGFEVTYIPVDKNGTIDLNALKKAIRKETILITIMHANNEVGTIQPIEEISKLAKENRILFHTDAVQTVGKLKIDLKEIPVDLLSFSGHKFHGPNGIGGLYVRKGVRLIPHTTGGGQENKKRAGTANVAGAVGMSEALLDYSKNQDAIHNHVKKVRDYFEAQVEKNIPEVIINAKDGERLVNTSSISFKFIEGESILLRLDLQGIYVSSGSACSSGDLSASHVLLSMGIPEEFAQSTIRFSFGRDNTIEEVDYVIESLKNTVAILRSMSPLWNK